MSSLMSSILLEEALLEKVRRNSRRPLHPQVERRQPQQYPPAMVASSPLLLACTHYAKCSLCGVLASTCRWPLSPLELIKTRLQVYPHQYTSFVQAASFIWTHQGGVRGLWTGWAPTAVAYGFQTGTKYCLYEVGKDTWSQSSNSSTSSNRSSCPPLWVYILSAACAEAVADILMCPWEMIKVKIQTDASFPQRLLPAWKTLWNQRKQQGTKSSSQFPFGSLGPIMARQIPATVVNFCTFEYTVQWVYRNILTQRAKQDYEKSTQLTVSVLVGFWAGAVAAVVSHPADSIVSRMSSGGSTGTPARQASVGQIIRHVGWYKLATQGLPTRMVLTGGIISLQWLVYDGMRTILGMGTSGAVAAVAAAGEDSHKVAVSFGTKNQLQCLATPALGHLGRPLRGSVRLSVLLCKYSDSPTPADDAAFYRRLMINSGTSGLNDYWSDISDGAIDLDGSTVRGWYTLDMTAEEARNRDPRVKKHSDCVDKAILEGYTPPEHNIVVVITSPGIDTFGFSGGVMLGEGVSLSLAGHESGHGIGMRHSFTTDTDYCNANWASKGEYGDPWDIMSHADTYSRSAGDFRRGGPGLNAYHLDRMGWIERDKIFRFGADENFDKVVTLLSPASSSGSGYRMVRIPFDPQDLQRYYTVEYRTSEDWDDGFPSDSIMIHEVSKRDFLKCSDGSSVDGQYRSYVLNDKPSNTLQESMNQNGVRVDVVSKNAGDGSAVVRIRSTRQDRCVVGYVWREARPSDHICVTPSRRTQVAAENASADANRDPNGGPYGPDTCKQGFVWREAFANDHVCVIPSRRTKAREENEQAYYKRIGFAAYGPLTCKQGYVWREADQRDYVCVTVGRRTEVGTENQLGPSRREPGGGAYGSDTCKQGFVWREAFPGDHVCVFPASRSKAASENEDRTVNLSRDSTNNAAASEGECVDLNCETTEDEIPPNTPTVLDDDASTAPGTPVLIFAAENDSDKDGDLDATSAFVKSGPSKGTLSNHNDGSFTYTPNSGFQQGQDSFVYEICDTDWLCGQATIRITIEDLSDREENCCDDARFALFCRIFQRLFGRCPRRWGA